MSSRECKEESLGVGPRILKRRLGSRAILAKEEPMDPRAARPVFRPRRPAIFMPGLAAFLGLVLSGCLVEEAPLVLPRADFAPPLLLDAGPTGKACFLLRFDEEARPVEGSFLIEPGGARPGVEAEGNELRVLPEEGFAPGSDYRVSGEVEDERGNRTRFFLDFVGWNENPARLALSELQPAKNSSKSAPHRDYVELLVLEAGNLGGMELAWASGAKLSVYRFPGVEAAKGEVLVLHAAPEGLSEEADELGADLGLSGGVDASPSGRDFWTGLGGFPDASGLLLLRDRPGGSVQDLLFYAEEGRAGPLGEGKLAELAGEAPPELWPRGGEAWSWEDAFSWKPSVSRPIKRRVGDSGGEAWFVGESGSQDPGRAGW